MSKIENAIIESTHIGFEDHGILSFNISFRGAGWGQGTGHYFAKPEGDLIRLVEGTLMALGASRWEDLKGMRVRIKRKDQCIVEVGDLIEDRWFRFFWDEDDEELLEEKKS